MIKMILTEMDITNNHMNTPTTCWVILPVSETHMYEYPWIWTMETAFKIGKVQRVLPRRDTWSSELTTHLEEIKSGVNTLHVYEPLEFVQDVDQLTRFDSSSITLITDVDKVVGKYKTYGTQPNIDDGNEYVHDCTHILNILSPDKFKQRPIISVITATIGSPYLSQCIQSIASQSYVGIIHWIVIDGAAYRDRVHPIHIKHQFTSTHKFLSLLSNTGTVNGSVVFYGHRIYASMSFLVNTPFIAFMDDDNTCTPDHYESMILTYQNTVKSITRHPNSLKRSSNHTDYSVDGVFSFRSIIDTHGTWICNDEFESLGCLSNATGYYLCDTSTYLLTTRAAIRCAPSWYSSQGDRGVLSACMYQHHCTLVTTYKPTLQYRLHTSDTRQGGLPKEFFLGKSIINMNKPILWIFHYNYHATIKALSAMYGYTRPSPVGDWQPYMLNGLGRSVHLMNGFNSPDVDKQTLCHIPYGANVLVHLCNPNTLPIQALQQRSDLNIITFTIESPNIQHQQQWNLSWLSTFSNKLLTYWTPLLNTPNVSYCCNYGRFFATRQQLLDTLVQNDWNIRPNRAIMVLARRNVSHTSNPSSNTTCETIPYTINNIPLRTLDSLRPTLVECMSELLPVDVAGFGWQSVPNGEILSTIPRGQDQMSTVDYYRRYRYVLITENCDADGYVSEKLQDAWIAGSVPIYIGNRYKETFLPNIEDMLIRIDAQDLSVDVLRSKLESTPRCLEYIYRYREHVLCKLCSPMTYATTYGLYADR